MSDLQKKICQSWNLVRPLIFVTRYLCFVVLINCLFAKLLKTRGLQYAVMNF